MKTISGVLLFAAVFSLYISATAKNLCAEDIVAASQLDRLPLTFEPNEGQADDSVRFLINNTGYAASIRRDGVSITLPHSVNAAATTISLQFLSVDQAVDIEPKNVLPGKSNYYIGKNPQSWHVNIPQFGRVQFGSVYPGVDAVFYGTRGNLEFDLHVSAQANTDRVRLRIAGADKLDIDSAGNLIASVAGQELRLLHPTIYEEVDGLRKRIDGGFVLAGRNEIGFSIAKRHLNSSLVIDPVLSYSTPLPLTGNVQGTAVDAAGNVYFTGWIPAAIGNGTNDVFISKLNSSGSAVLYTTVFGGSASDSGTAVAADSNGNAYVTGTTGSLDFPTTPGVFMSTCPSPCSQSSFLTKILANGTIGYSTYTGGSSTSAFSIAVDGAGDAYITGSTGGSDLPLVNAFQSTPAGVFVQKFDPTGSYPDYSTYLGGGDANEGGRGIAIDASGSAYVVGTTSSAKFPLKNPIQSSLVNTIFGDPFITKFTPDGSALVYSTYFGGSAWYGTDNGDVPTGIAVDPTGNAHIAGLTNSGDFPLTLNAYDTLPMSSTYASKSFMTVLNASGNALLFSTLLEAASPMGVAVDSKGNSYVTGVTTSRYFPALNALETTSQATAESNTYWVGFVSEFDLTGKLLFSTYLTGEGGSQPLGIGVDARNRVYVTMGGAGGGDFPLVRPIGSFLHLPCCSYMATRTSPTAAPQLSLSPRTSPFLSLRNVGSAALTISSIIPSSNFVMGGNCGSSLAPGTGCKLVLAGTADGKKSGTVTITTNTSSTPQKFTIQKSATGDNVGPVIVITPDRLDYPPQLVGYSSTTQQVTVSNIGLQPSTISGISTSGDFGETNNCPAVLPASAMCTVTVTYRPSTSGNGTSSLGVSHDGVADSVYLSGVGSASAIIVSDSFLRFGTQSVGAAALARIVNVTNTTPYPTTVTSVATNGDYSQVNTCNAPLPPYASCRAAVSFTPSTNEKATGTLTATSYGPGGAQNATLYGTGLIAAGLAVNPFALSFPQAVLGTKMGPQTVNVTNTTGAGISVTSVQTTAPFSQTNNCVGTLAAGSTCQIQAYFKPTQLNPVSGSIQISFVGNGSPQMISLTGYALTLIYLTPNPLVFGQQQVGTQSSQQGFSIENLSSRQSFTISSITLQGSDFILAGNNCPTKLLPDYGCGAQIVFAPTGTGTRTGTVTVVASDSAQPHIEQLQGIGVGAGQVSLSSSSLTFAPQTVGTTSTAKVVEVTNTGSATLNLGTITAAPLFFIATTGCGATLAVGGTCNISVKFSPTLAGILVGTLTINDDASGNPHLVALTGIGQ